MFRRVGILSFGYLNISGDSEVSMYVSVCLFSPAQLSEEVPNPG